MVSGEFSALLIWHPDRLYRSPKDLERIIEIATVKAGDVDLSAPAGRMVARILGSVARQESEHKGDRQRRANEQRAAEGKWYTANRCFGYTMAGEPLEPEATAARTAVADVLAGKSIRKVGIEWNEQGLKTTLGTTWNSPRVRRLLVNPRYAALRTYRGVVVGPGSWEPLIDPDTHRGLVAFLSDPSRIKCTSFERKYIGSGVYRCGKCEGGLMKSAQPGGRKNRAYICRDHAHVLRAGEPVDAYVQARLDELASLFADGAIDGSQLRRGSTELRSRLAVLDSELAGLARTNPVADLLGAGDRLTEKWAALSKDLQGKVVNELMTVTVLPAPRGRRAFDPEYIHIDWKTGQSVARPSH